MSFIKDTIDDAAGSIIGDYLMYKIEDDYLDELRTIQDAKMPKTEKSRAAKKIFNELKDEDFYDMLYQVLDNALVYYADQDKVIAEYGLNNAINLYQDEFGELPKDNPAGALAFVVLENEFLNKYEFEDLIKKALSLRAAKRVKSMNGRKTRAWKKNPKNPVTKAMFRKMVFGTKKRSGRITVKRTIGKKPARVSVKKMF